MQRRPRFPSLRRFAQDTSGAQLVEFCMVLPLMLVLFATIIEGSRMMWSYQTVVAGVRDAARYLARTTQRDICDEGADVSASAATLADIVRTASDGSALFPGGVTVTSVQPSLDCVAGSFRSDMAPIVTVRAELTVTFPFAGIFTLVGGTQPTLETSVTDQSRVYGS